MLRVCGCCVGVLVHLSTNNMGMGVGLALGKSESLVCCAREWWVVVFESEVFFVQSVAGGRHVLGCQHVSWKRHNQGPCVVMLLVCVSQQHRDGVVCVPVECVVDN